MSIVISEIKMPLNHQIDDVFKKACQILGVQKNEYLDIKIVKKSLDARKKDQIQFVYNVSLDFKNEQAIFSKRNEKNTIKLVKSEQMPPLLHGGVLLTKRPIIIGSGPSGLFAGLMLSMYGFRPLILEKGEDVDTRAKTVSEFLSTGKLNISSNVQFGEGGAGTFSDGKLTTRINDERCNFILKTFYECGAPEEILYLAKPHIGTDHLKKVIKNLRTKIIEHGGEIIFNKHVTDFVIKNNAINVVKTKDDDFFETTVAVLACGHSARDIYQLAVEKQLDVVSKPFSVGVRIEHLQHDIDVLQYGSSNLHPNLPPAEYQLSYRKNDDACYTFCMCPGGVVMPAQSEENTIVTNGMSTFRRNGKNANSAVVVSVDQKTFGSGILDGMAFQQQLESAAFMLTNKSLKAPVQLTKDFLNDQLSDKCGDVLPSYPLGFEFKHLSTLFPQTINNMLKEGLLNFNQKTKGFVNDSSILTGVETRTSAPVRILRGENGISNINGIYPTGEGAGYAGGIVSSAVDGIKIAEKIITNYKPSY